MLATLCQLVTLATLCQLLTQYNVGALKHLLTYLLDPSAVESSCLDAGQAQRADACCG